MADKPARLAGYAWLRRLDMALGLFIVGFAALVIYNAVSAVAMAWPFLILRELHNHIGRLALGLALVMLGVAVYVGIIRKGDVTPLFRRATYIIFGAIVLQALMGLGLYLIYGARPREEVHLIYGLGTVLALPFFIFVETTAKKRPAMGSYIWGFALLAGVIIRSIMTAG
jgi:hypothetical protein